jgi:predicted nuclease of predicted toxin-antitoxin system
MRILIDECLDPGIRDFLAGHQVTTVGEANWQSTADHQLVQLAEGNFDVLVNP